MTNTYLVTGKSNGHLELVYKDELLNVVEFAFKPPLNQKSYERLIEQLPYDEKELKAWVEVTGLKIEKQIATNERIALFCKLYESKTNIKYKVSPADAGKMKGLKISSELLDFYFASDNFLFKNKYSINNLTKYYNELCVEMANANKSKYPDHWSLEYENKLQQNEVYQYWAHLRSLGLAPKKDRVGKTTEWIKKEHLEK